MKKQSGLLDYLDRTFLPYQPPWFTMFAAISWTTFKLTLIYLGGLALFISFFMWAFS